MDDPTTKFASTGSVIQPEYAQRNMKCYAVTESELKQIGLANLAVTICFGIGSGLLGLGIDIFKDTTLADSVPPNANVVVNTVQPILFIFGIVFWLAAAALWFWRRDMLSLIRKESK